MSDYKFSVLMSVYYKENADFFDLALNSNLCDQTLKPDEFVLVCDGELTDSLNKVIEKYENLYPEILKVYRLQENVGLGKALNYGLEKCQYELVARADSDDICVPERFEKQIEFIKNNPDIAVVGSWIDEFNTDYNEPVNNKPMPCTHNEIIQMGKSRNPLNHMTVMFKKSAVLNVGSYQDMPYSEDYYLWVRLIANGYKLANIGENLVHARIGNGMVQRRANKTIIRSRYLINKYMLKNKMINCFTMVKNVGGMAAFIFAPIWLKSFVYKRILRKR